MFKNKFTKYIITAILVLASLFTAVSCTQNDNDGDGEVAEITKLKFQGVHDLTAPDSQTDFLVQGGATNYTLVIPAVASDQMRVAKSEFIDIFYRTTGVNILTVKDDEVDEHSATACYISLGDTTMAQSANIPNYNKSELGVEGVRIYTKDKTIYILGGSDEGVIQAVYRFMEIYFDFDHYYRNCVSFNTVGPNEALPLKMFNVTDIPDIAFRSMYYSQMTSINADRFMDSDSVSGATLNDVVNRARRHGLQSTHYTVLQSTYSKYADQESKDMTYEEMMQDVTLQPKVTGTRGTIHNEGELLPQSEIPSKYANDNSNWYSDLGPHFCYTAHGDPESLDAFTSACAKKIIASLIMFPPATNPTMNAVGITIEDTSGYCNCAACQAAFAADGNSPCGAVIRFCNMVAEKVVAWMELDGNEEYYRDNFQVVFFAYSGMIKAPSIKNEATGEYEPANDNVLMSKNVCVYTVPEFCTYQYVYTQDSQAQHEARELMKSWACLTDNIWVYLHGIDFKRKAYPHNSLNHVNNDFYQLLAYYKVKFLFDECNSGGTNGTAFFNLRNYIEGELAWDSTKDMNELVDKYFNNMYKDAAKYMKAYYEASCLNEVKVLNQYGDRQVQKSNIMMQTYMYPLETLYEWFGLFDQAYASIERYKTTNYNLYRTIKDRIDQEYLAPLYVTCELYCDPNSNYLTSQDRLMYINKFKEIMNYTQYDYATANSGVNLKKYANNLK